MRRGTRFFATLRMTIICLECQQRASCSDRVSTIIKHCKTLEFQKWAMPLYPRTSFRAVEHCLDYFQIGYGIFDWCGGTCVIQDGLRERVPLECVLIADVKLDFLNVFSNLVPDFAWLVWRSVERDFDLDAACCAIDVDALIGYQLG